MQTQLAQELIPFNQACEEFVSGKYILADVKISSILRIIEEDEKLSNIISSCLVNFDFGSAFSSLVKETDEYVELSLPTDEKRLVAFVYGLLYRFHNNSLNFYDFINKFFKADDENPGKEFYNFATSIITPFKDAIEDIYSKRHVIVDSEDYQKNFYNKLTNNVKLFLNNIDDFKIKMNEKEEFSLLLNSLYIASEKNDKKMVFSLMIALDYFSRCNKKTRSAYLALEDCFTNT